MFRFPQLIINAESNEFASNMPAKQEKGEGKLTRKVLRDTPPMIWFSVL